MSGDLPPGLSLDATSGVISGTPIQGGTFAVTVFAQNAFGGGSFPTSSGTLTFTIQAPPVITSATTATVETGAAFTYQIVATNSPTNYSADGLPENLTLDAATGIITGAPAVAGTFAVTLSATNPAGTGRSFLLLTVSAPSSAVPVITSAATASAQMNVAFFYRIEASNAPTGYTATGLPVGLSLDAATGIIAGTPSDAAGVFKVMLGATNASGTGTATLVLTLSAASTVTTPPVVTVTVASDGMAVEGGEAGKVKVTRTGGTTAALSVRYKIVGGAVAGRDYKALSGTVTIPIGASQAKIKIKPIDDSTRETLRIAKVKLKPATDGSYTLGSPTAARIEIVDND